VESRLAGRTPPEVAALLEDVVEQRIRDLPDPAIHAMVRMLDARGARVSALAEHIGLSERQLLRRCVAALGYGPKTLDRILRFQRFVAAARQHDLGLARLAADAGYADQPHLTRECVRLAGTTPATLLGRLQAGPFRSRRDRPTPLVSAA
jgi:AraC-like DNA-binding protein